jgi:hypothetical protein
MSTSKSAIVIVQYHCTAQLIGINDQIVSLKQYHLPRIEYLAKQVLLNMMQSEQRYFRIASQPIFCSVYPEVKQFIDEEIKTQNEMVKRH